MPRKPHPAPKPEPIPSTDGVDRRGFLACMAWVGTGVLWSMSGGVLTSCTLSPDKKTVVAPKADFSFVQLSDSHIGFSKDPNKNVTATLELAIAKINAMQDANGSAPAFVLHTGDLTHLSKSQEFDTVDQLLKTARVERTFYVPGEHDFLTDDGQSYLDRYGKGTLGAGWHSFDYHGTHFIGLVNVHDLKAGGLGVLGAEQLEWLRKDVAGLASSTPIVVYAHIPLWTVYEKWGWGTQDSAQAISCLRRFGSVTVLNGHIHQVMQKVEGNITFHTARSTAFPQPAPGSAASPGPMKNVAADKLKSMLGLAAENYTETPTTLAIIDSTLG